MLLRKYVTKEKQNDILSRGSFLGKKCGLTSDQLLIANLFALLFRSLRTLALT